jgi:hypothetical protein
VMIGTSALADDDVFQCETTVALGHLLGGACQT